MLTFDNKAGTLERLTTVIKNAKILPLYRFKVNDYKSTKEDILSAILNQFADNRLIVRSSAQSEDLKANSNAGHFNSVLNVHPNRAEIEKSIESVIASYNGHVIDDEVFIQPMMEDVSIAGVVFTCDIDTMAPYYIISYDNTGKTDAVTSGKSNEVQTYVLYKHAPEKLIPSLFIPLIKGIKEIEELFRNPYLDIEFGLSNSGELYIFQVRPIVTVNKEDLSHLDFDDALLKLYKKIKKLSAPHPNLLGSKAIYGVMPDWNPAEIIGIKPQPLAYTLYKELITDSIWAYQRNNYGYRNLRSHPLMTMFFGVPYIDVRVDFNSFIPKQLDDQIARKLVDHYLNKLSSNPDFHDKVEFEIVHSCFYFTLPDNLNQLVGNGFTMQEIKQIKESLLNLTNEIIEPNFGHYRRDVDKLNILEEKYEQVVNSKLSIIDKIYWLVENCKRYGTLPFAGIARAAFIATQMLKSMEELKIISAADHELLIKSLNTVTKSLNRDVGRFATKKMSKEEFLNKYGHLRPKTYDILSPRYDQNFENYFLKNGRDEYNEISFNLDDSQMMLIQEWLEKLGMKVTANELIEFIKDAIEKRELSKFIFTKSLSKVIQLIEELGTKLGVSKKDLAFIDVRTVLCLYSSVDHRNLKQILSDEIDNNKALYEHTKAVKFPGLITSPEDIYGFFIQEGMPNYITLKKIIAPVILEDQLQQFSCEAERKIVLIRSADPGYDYLFSKNIAGLITLFGGANSHMALRCAELGIPAVIGAGEKNFACWSGANTLEIDCVNQQVRIIE